jgi:hypothetical protein
MFGQRLPYALALLAISACVAPEAQQADVPVAASGTGSVSGIAGEALIAESYLASEKFFVLLYLPAKISAAQKAAAPERLCASKGLQVSEVEDKPLEHPGELPGAMKLVVRCK